VTPGTALSKFGIQRCLHLQGSNAEYESAILPLDPLKPTGDFTYRQFNMQEFYMVITLSVWAL